MTDFDDCKIPSVELDTVSLHIYDMLLADYNKMYKALTRQLSNKNKKIAYLKNKLQIIQDREYELRVYGTPIEPENWSNDEAVKSDQTTTED